MPLSERYLVVPLLGLLLAGAVSCESSKQKTAATSLPAEATAPELPREAAPQPASASVDEPPAPAVAEDTSDTVESLIAEVDAKYQQGEESYLAGHLEAARQSFDSAFDLLLTAPVPVRSDARLKQRFDRLVEEVHALELQALKEGDGFTAQTTEPAPIDEAADITFPVDPHIKARAEAEVRETVSDLPLLLNDHVASFITYFSTRGRPTLENGLIRAGRYREMIARILQEEGVPQDLIYVAQAESGFKPLALSRAGARGMWQFMAGTAKLYDLERNWWIDERQDPERATRAAARHLRDLYKQFGDWYLAIAAYNTGAGNVQRAVQRTGYADFWELYRRGVLPRETRNYVPIILAVTIMAKNPHQYGLTELETEAPQRVDRVLINYPLDLRLAAECADTTVATLQELNPALLRLTTPKDREFELRLPVGTAQRFHANIAAIPKDMRVWWRYHKVAAGETLAGIARQYRTSVQAISESNNLQSTQVLADSRLIIPITPGTRSGDVVFSKTGIRYRIRRGDTLSGIAREFDVPVAQLKRWNRLRSNNIVAGKTLLIYPAIGGAVEPPQPAAKRSQAAGSRPGSQTTTIYTVRKGDTLYSIANAHKTTVSALLRDNEGISALLQPGDRLVIHSSQ